LDKSTEMDIRQYFFLKTLEYIKLPALRKFCIGFDQSLREIPCLREDVIDDLTRSVAAFLQSVEENLQVLEMINCPVKSTMLRELLPTFPCLFRVVTGGNFLVHLDRHGSEAGHSRNVELHHPPNNRPAAADLTIRLSDIQLNINIWDVGRSYGTVVSILIKLCIFIWIFNGMFWLHRIIST